MYTAGAIWWTTLKCGSNALSVFPIIGKRDVISKTGCTHHIKLSSEEDQATAKGYIYRKFCDCLTCRFWDMQGGRQSYRDTYCNALHCCWGWSSSSSHGSSGGGSDSSSVSVVVVVVVVVACWCRMRTSLLSLLTRGLSMSTDELAGIVPLVSVFCALFSHVLTLMHDVEFFEDQPTSTSVYLSASSSISYLPEYWTRSVSRQEVVGGDQTWV